MNRYSNLSTSRFNPLSMDEIMAVPMAKQRQHDELASAADAYSALQSQRLSQDAGVVDAELQALRGRADAISDDLLNNGVNRDSIRKFRNLKRDKEVAFGQQGIIGAAAGNYQSAMSFINDLATKKEQQAGWSPARAKAWAEAQVAGFKGTLNDDGTFNTFQGRGLQNKVDRNKWINQNLKNVAADTNPILLKYAGNLDDFNRAYRSGKITEKDFNKIIGSLSSMAANDTDLMASLQQESFFTGEQDATNIGKWSIRKNPQTGKNEEVFEPGSSFGRQLYAAASGAKFKNVDFDYKIIEDKAAWELYKKGLEAKEADDLVRAAHGEANTITPENIGKIKDNVDLALNEMNRQEALLNNFQGDKNSREYQELKSNHDESKIKYFNLKNKVDNIEVEALKDWTPHQMAMKKAADYLVGFNGDISSALRSVGITPEDEYSNGVFSNPAHNRNIERLMEYYGADKDQMNINAGIGLVNEIRSMELESTKAYLEQNPYSESYTEFGGLASGKGTSQIGLINKNLTENFDGANYSVAYTGESLNALLADKYGGDEITKEIRTTNGYDESGFPIEHLIIRDEDGNVVESMSVTRGQLGLVENRKVAQSLMNSTDPTLNQEGQQMWANITYMPTIKRAGLREGGNAGVFPDKRAMIDGEPVQISWESRVNVNGSQVWTVKIGDSITSPDLYGENEIALYLANLGKQ